MTAQARTFAKAAVLSGICLFVAFPAHAQMLISEQEAALPAAADTSLTMRGVTRGPKVQVLSPATDRPVQSPLNLKLKFESFGGAKIDPASFKATYLKSPAVDLTQRMQKFVKANGIEMDGAEVPPGEHIISVQLRDSEGRAGSVNFKINVAK
jgi:hypothetical protein